MITLNKITKIGCCLLCTIALSFCVSSSFGQTIQSLEKEINNSKEQIKKAEEMLKSNKNLEMSNLEQLSLVRSQMKNRQTIVANMRKQRDIINGNISSNSTVIRKLQQEHSELQQEYAEMMVVGYKNYLFSNSLLFLFGAKDFNELQMRIYYIRRYSNLRYELSVKIDAKAEEVTVQSDSLKGKRKELETLVANTQKEITALNADSKKYNSILANIQRDTQKLNLSIKQYQSNIRKLQNKIQEIIAEEARKERERQAKASQATKDQFVAVSGEFGKLKGLLPSPTSNGIMVEGFGRHQLPTQKTVTVDNKGVNFQVPKDSKIRVIADGVVTKVFFFQGLNNTVMVRHGEYITTYSGLTTVSVEKGDVLKCGDTLGNIGESKTLHFELWKGTTNLNPELWLKL